MAGFNGEALVAGPYTCTWNGVAMGLFQGDSDVPTLSQQFRRQPVERSDRWGQTRVDSIHMGKAYQVMGVMMEYSKSLAIIDPFGTFGAALGTIGVFVYSLAKALVFTALAGTTAATAPATLTASKTIAADDLATQLAYGPQLRVVPIKLDVYPYDVGGGVFGFFTMT